MEAYARKHRDDFAGARSQFESAIVEFEADGVMRMHHDELERLADANGRRIACALLQDHLTLRSINERRHVNVVGSDDVARTHVRERSRPLLTLVGKVRVERLEYSKPGAAALRPLDAALNLPAELYSFEVRRRSALECAKGSFDEAVEVLKTLTGAPVPKRQIEQLAQRACADFDAFYELRRPVPTLSTTKLLVLSFDGKGIAMRHEDLRKETRQRAAKFNRKLRRRLCKGEKRHRKRMAQVAAVYDLETFERTGDDVVADLQPVRDAEAKRKRPRAENKRVWASAKQEAEDVIFAAFEEALRRDPLRQRRWIVLVDGEVTQLERVQACADGFGVKITIVLDVIHLIEYLWKAGRCFCAEDSAELEQWVNRHLLRVLHGNAATVAGGIRRSATKRGLKAQAREHVDECAEYLLNKAALVRYDEYMKDGLPIATGVIEGACRHLIQDRMGRTGARWSLEGAEAILRLRSIRSSGDFEEYWRFHVEKERQRNHLEEYKNAQPPNAQPALRLITT